MSQCGKDMACIREREGLVSLHTEVDSSSSTLDHPLCCSLLSLGCEPIVKGLGSLQYNHVIIIITEEGVWSTHMVLSTQHQWDIHSYGLKCWNL